MYKKLSGHDQFIFVKDMKNYGIIIWHDAETSEVYIKDIREQ